MIESSHGRKFGMSYEIYLTETFQKSIKVLKKKYRRVKDDMASTIEALEEDPTIGGPNPRLEQRDLESKDCEYRCQKGKTGWLPVNLPLEIRRDHCLSIGSIFQGR